MDDVPVDRHRSVRCSRCVNTGAIDAMPEIAQLAREHGAWCHVDGAFGLWAAASPALRTLVDGVSDADSWATDAHKLLSVPYDSGVAIVRDRAAHAAAMNSFAGVEYIPSPSTTSATRPNGCPSSRAARAGSRSMPRCANWAAKGSPTWSSAAVVARA